MSNHTKNTLYFLFSVVVSLTLFAEVNPPTRPRIDDLQKESSSFVADPDPLDPLPLKKESLKEDEEPVLEDIRQVLNSPTKKKEVVTAPQAEDKPKNEVTHKKTRKTKLSKTKISKNKKRTVKINANLNPDEPDLTLEKKLNRIYQIYNIKPTSAEEWARVTGDRKVQMFTVVKGNTLESISRTLFGDNHFWPKIWALNHTNITNPHQIYPGLKIYFYPATDIDLPSLSIDQQQSPTGLADTQVFTKSSTIASSDLSPDGRDYTSQNTVFNQSVLKGINTNKNRMPVPQPVPDSIPLVRSSAYYLKLAGQKTIIDLQVLPTPELVAPENPYILSAEKVLPDYKVPEDQAANLLCDTNQFVPQVNKINLQAGAGKYLIVEPIDTENSRLKKTYIYKITGEVAVTENQQMRISNCKQLMNSDSLIVSESKMHNLPEPTETFAGGLNLIESLEMPTQNFFNFGQLVIINSGNAATSKGQNLDIFSESVGAVVGKVQVIKRTGSLSIGFLTGVSHVIKLGDLITVADGAPSSSLPSPSENLPALNTETDSELKLE